MFVFAPWSSAGRELSLKPGADSRPASLTSSPGNLRAAPPPPPSCVPHCWLGSCCEFSGPPFSKLHYQIHPLCIYTNSVLSQIRSVVGGLVSTASELPSPGLLDFGLLVDPPSRPWVKSGLARQASISEWAQMQCHTGSRVFADPPLALRIGPSLDENGGGQGENQGSGWLMLSLPWSRWDCEHFIIEPS